MTSPIFNLRHEVRIINGKRCMVCIEHFCDIDGMSEGEYYKAKRKIHNSTEVGN